MFQLKPISRDSVPKALEKAERYRLLNEPWLTESICSDILEADPDNSRAVAIMILAITDQFGSSTSSGINQARQLLPLLGSDYEREYYSGIICERQGKSIINKGGMEAGFIAYEWLRDAMEHYEKAESVRPADNDDALLRWNTCVRLITHYHLQPRNEESFEPPLE